MLIIIIIMNMITIMLMIMLCYILLLIILYASREAVHAQPLQRAGLHRQHQGIDVSPPRLSQSYMSKGIWRQGIGSFVRNSYVSTLCPVVICPYWCTSDSPAGEPHGQGSGLGE